MKTFWLTFGSGPTSENAGLSPTFTVFLGSDGSFPSPPGVTAPSASLGAYLFQYFPGPTLSIYFELDGGSGLSDTDRYIKGTLDPIQAVDQKVGTIDDSFGSTSMDPSTLLGYAKRLVELLEGNAEFDKSTGIWSIYSRGSSTMLREKTLTNSLSSATKT